MMGRQNHDDIVPGHTFPRQSRHVLEGGWRAQPHKAQVNFPSFQRAKLFGGRHVEQVDRNLGTGLVKCHERCGQKIEIELEQVAKVELAVFAAAEPLHGLYAFETQRHQPPGIHLKTFPFFSQRHLVSAAVQKT